jgi:beta-glucanase (GH16 family)
MAATRHARTLTALGTALCLALPAIGIPTAQAAATLPVVDDFEEPLFTGSEGAVPLGFFTAQDTQSTTTFERTPAVPEPLPGSAADNNALRTDFDVTAFGVVIHAFADQATSTWTTQDWSAYEGLQFWMHGTGSGTSLFVDVVDNRNPGSTTDDGERFSVAFTDDTAGWQLVQLPFEDMSRKEIGNGAPNDGFQLTEVHGWAFGALTTEGTETFYLDDVEVYGTAPERPLTVGFTTPSFTTTEGEDGQVGLRLSKASEEPVDVRVRTTQSPAEEGVDYTPVDTTVTIPAGETTASLSVPTFGDEKYSAERIVLLEIAEVTGAELGRPPGARLVIADDETPDPDLVEDFETTPYLWDSPSGDELRSTRLAADDPLALPGQEAPEGVLQVDGSGEDVTAYRRFPVARDWTGRNALSMWVYGNGSGETLDVTLTNPTVGPGEGAAADWPLVWSDEFDAPAGTPPDPTVWTHEIGDGTVIGKPGWGNDELQYYTDSTDNVAHDGEGNLVITTREVTDGSGPTCYYGPCRYTSARLVTQDKLETAYGRIEARVKVPVGEGLWPAFWTLGDDIVENPWPQAGEIDIMEHVGREPFRVFGTIHGPGYSGGQSYGGDYIFDVPVAEEFHEYAVEWRPEEIVWEVDGIRYHEAVPADVAPNEWVFEHPFFLLLNTAVGGNFGGTVGEVDFPQTTTVDYVRIYQADTQDVEFTASVVDDTEGWRLVTLPLASFVDADGTPVDPSNVSSLALQTPVAAGSSLLLDQIRLGGCADDTVVDSAADSGPGSLRAALAGTCEGSTITLDPALDGETVELSSPLTVARDVTVDGSQAPGVVLDGQGASRILEVEAGVEVTLSDLVLTRGYGYELAGAVLNNGDLTLSRSEVTDSVVDTSGNEFWKGGGGIYTGENGTLTLVESTVADNTVNGGPGGGLYGFFGSTTLVSRSTVSGNSASDVGGGMRSLGTTDIVTSTVSGNSALGWHGGALFATDGDVTVTDSTVTGNTSPDGTAGGMLVATFGDSSAHLTVRGSVVVDNSGTECGVVDNGGGTVLLSSGGHNVTSDGTCGAAASGDVTESEPVLEPLADNGGPTATHLPVAGSVVIDNGDPDQPEGTDQRGVARPQGSAPDSGSVELEPTPAQQVAALQDTVAQLGLPRGITTALGSTLRAAMAALEADDPATACDTLGAFLHQVQALAGKKLDDDQAAELTTLATEVRADLSCG